MLRMIKDFVAFYMHHGFPATYMITSRVSVLAVFATFFGVAHAQFEGLGTALSIGTGLLPPEMRGIAGSVANAALAKQNKARGIIEVAPDGSDYPWICLCPTPGQLALLKKTKPDIKADKCPEDPEMGCKPPQVNMDNAPLPILPSPKPPKI